MALSSGKRLSVHNDRNPRPDLFVGATSSHGKPLPSSLGGGRSYSCGVVGPTVRSSSPGEAFPLNTSVGYLFQYSQAFRGPPEAQERLGEVSEERI